jgi:hypothetical protein
MRKKRVTRSRHASYCQPRITQMDQTSTEPSVLDWDFDIEDEACFSFSVDEALSGTKAEMLNVSDLYRTTTTAPLMIPETSDLFRILSDSSDTCSSSNDDENQIVAFDSDHEDVQQDNVTNCLATDARGR